MNRFTRSIQQRLSARANIDPIAHITVQTGDSWSARLSYWSQIGTLAVVVFGYFYTVRPVFQNQLLQEQAAQLQLDSERAKQDLKATQEKQLAAASALESTNSQLLSIKVALADETRTQRQLCASLAAALRNELSAKTEAQKDANELDKSRSALRRAQEHLLFTGMVMSTLTGTSDDEVLMNQHYLAAYSKRFEGDTDGAFIAGESKDWPNPYERLKQVLEVARPAKPGDDNWIPVELIKIHVGCGN
jgi:hypothetical protein